MGISIWTNSTKIQQTFKIKTKNNLFFFLFIWKKLWKAKKKNRNLFTVERGKKKFLVLLLGKRFESSVPDALLSTCILIYGQLSPTAIIDGSVSLRKCILFLFRRRVKEKAWWLSEWRNVSSLFQHDFIFYPWLLEFLILDRILLHVTPVDLVVVTPSNDCVACPLN